MDKKLKNEKTMSAYKISFVQNAYNEATEVQLKLVEIFFRYVPITKSSVQLHHVLCNRFKIEMNERNANYDGRK